MVCEGKEYTVTEVEGFEGRRIETVSFPSSLRKINSNAFSNNNLTSVSFPEGLKEIIGAFSNNRLTEVQLPESLEYLYNPFSGNDIKSITIPENVKYCYLHEMDLSYLCIKSTPPDDSSLYLSGIGGEDNKIEEIVLGPSDDEFDKLIEVECDRLTIKRPFSGSIHGIHDQLLYEGDDIAVLPFGGYHIYWNDKGMRKFPEEIIVRGNRVEISPIINGTIDGTFIANSSPTEWLGMLDDVKKIDIQCADLKLESHAFANMKSLGSLNLDVSSTCELGSGMLYNCNELRNIRLPSIDGLPIGALQNCKSLQELSVPASARFINSLALRGCDALHKIEIEPSAEPLVVGVGTVVEIKLQELTLGREVVSGDMPFYGLKSLAKLTIAANVTELPDYAFADCSNLKEIYCESSIAPKIKPNTFRGVSREKCKVYVTGDDGDYRISDGWKEFFASVEDIHMQDEAISIYSSGDRLCVKSEKDIILAIYTSQGIEAIRQQIHQGENSFDLAEGYYIIVAGNKTYKYRHSAE